MVAVLSSKQLVEYHNLNGIRIDYIKITTVLMSFKKYNKKAIKHLNKVLQQTGTRNQQ